ncbi:acyltransferase [Oesophagostomum dentatum]|uniref:Acyltransferase n=1 Tax=Oesophagostomum dentatum TaxID=61180 RepID=A0A0B1TSJ4_OESDE|nr:acyltransferase [Oesophagostomum dentatum]
MAQKRLDIQGVRAWAIVLVLLFHFFPSVFPNGYVGVDMWVVHADVFSVHQYETISPTVRRWFFVVSGFLMVMILSKNDDLGIKSFGSFYYRRDTYFNSHMYFRIKRILPLYYLVVLLAVVVVLLGLPRSFQSLNLASSRRAVFLISNIKEDDVNQIYEKMVSTSIFCFGPTNVFKRKKICMLLQLIQAEDLFTHTWSLSVEMQWYIIVPVVYLIQRRLADLGKLFIVGLAASSAVLYFLLDINVAFYSVFARIWQFCCGILAFIWDYREVSRRS